jgi:hypothetical protein
MRTYTFEEKQGIRAVGGGKNSQRPMKIVLGSLVNTNAQII